MNSVCMATYNGGKYIREQVDSILAQLGPADELVVSDDGSTDDTCRILDSYCDDRIKIFKNEGRHGVVRNFENALKHASGDYIFLSDQDDIWLPNKVNVCVAALANGTDLVLHDAQVVNQTGAVVVESFFALRGSRTGYWKNLYRNSFLGCCLAFRKEILRYALPFPMGIAMHDIWIGLMVSKKGRVKLLREPLLFYRRHGANASPTAEKSDFSFAKQLSYRLRLLANTLFK